ncbi:MAG TPA: SMI1/KNR4 family protein [Thermomicrobiales bacterium]|jgi:hypothetical protein
MIDWSEFLHQWNSKLLASPELIEELKHWPNDDLEHAAENGWLGYPGVTEVELMTTEARLGRQLPPSYRAFLSTSNGWRFLGNRIPKLWSAQEIEWLPTRHRESIDAWLEGERFDTESAIAAIPDSEYFVYGEAQEPFTVRSEYLHTALDISAVEIAGTAMYLLNPQVIVGGEWEAWLWAHWLPGAYRYRSFDELVLAAYQTF